MSKIFSALILLLLCLVSSIVLSQPSQSPSNASTKKEQRHQKKALKLQSKQEKKHQKEQLQFKADSIKISAMLALRNSLEAKQVDSLKRVMKNSKQIAKDAILKSEEVKEITKALDPYLDHYKQYKSKLTLLDSGNTDALLQEGKSLGLQELNNNEQYKELTKDLKSYTKHLDKSNPLDSAKRQALLQDAKQLGIQELSTKEEFKDIKKELSPYLDSPYLKGVKLLDLDSMSLDSLKTLSVSTFQKLEKRLEQEILKRDELKEFNTNIAEFEALKGLPESYRKQFDKYKYGEGLQKEAMAEAAKKASALLSKHSKEIQSAQTQLSKLKKKYSSVLSSNDLSTATKRNSLQGQPIKKRIVLGINFQIVSLDPVIIDFNPLVGYKFNKKFHVAIGGSYRARFTESHTNSQLRIGQDELTYGYRAITDYNVWKMLSIHAEYERISKEFEIGTSDTFKRNWVGGALAGISSSYSVKGKVEGNFSVLYNFLYNFKQAVYTSPWVFRFGLSR